MAEAEMQFSHSQEPIKIARIRNPLSSTGDGQVGEVKPAENLALITKVTCCNKKFVRGLKLI